MNYLGYYQLSTPQYWLFPFLNKFPPSLVANAAKRSFKRIGRIVETSMDNIGVTATCMHRHFFFLLQQCDMR